MPLAARLEISALITLRMYVQTPYGVLRTVFRLVEHLEIVLVPLSGALVWLLISPSQSPVASHQ